MDKSRVISYVQYDTLNSLVRQGLSSYKIADELSVSQTTIKYWLKKYKLSTKKQKDLESKTCPKCKITYNSSEFYNRRNGLDLSPYCKKCSKTQTVERQRKLKQICVEYKGGKCSVCDYSKSVAALDFHHLNPKEKDFSISHVKCTSFNDKIKKELDKCILLCKNCHAELHFLNTSN